MWWELAKLGGSEQGKYFQTDRHFITPEETDVRLEQESYKKKDYNRGSGMLASMKESNIDKDDGKNLLELI